MTAIEIKDLNTTYGKDRILKNLSFSVNQGEFFVIIGPNGSGKTTLLKTINGIIKPQAGSLEIQGRSFRDYTWKSLAKITAFVPQEVPSDFPFTVEEVVLMGRSPHLGILGMENLKDKEIARSAMKFTHVSKLAGRRLNQLSGGERQRVFIARAVCQEPQIILLDEPTAALDLAHQINIMDLMERLKKEKGITIIMVSHDVNLAAIYGERLLLLKKGEIISIGRPDEVINFEILERAYGCVLMVNKSSLGNFPQVTLVPQKFLNKAIEINNNQ
ncbi:iron complex transport system ATP-binding protein [Candidatus Magnetomoraceae bacterium gMMP-15]